jgi:hypothetical protein
MNLGLCRKIELSHEIMKSLNLALIFMPQNVLISSLICRQKSHSKRDFMGAFFKQKNYGPFLYF